MRHSDDQINERLKKALADRFKSIHDQPDPQLSKIILGSIKSKNRFAKPVGLALLAFLTICISIAVDDQPLPPVSHPIVRNKTGMQSSKINAHSEPQNIQERADISIIESAVSEPGSATTHIPLPEKRNTENDSSGTLLPVIAANALVLNELDYLDNLPFRDYTAMQLPGIEKVVREHSPIATENHWRVVVGFTPMNTFQVVKIGAQQKAAYQNFRFPVNFSRRKIAYKFHAGIENNGFQLLLTYAQVRQVFDYELATKEFVLDNEGNPIRKGLRQEQDATDRKSVV